MMVLDYVHVSALMMRQKPVRSALSLLGVYIGALSLLAILSIQEGVGRRLGDTYRTEGAQIVSIEQGYDEASGEIGRLTLADVERLGELPQVLAAAPRFSAEKPVRTAGGAAQARFLGVDEGFLGVYRIPVVKGRSFLADEVEKRLPVCLLTEEGAAKLFPVGEPVGGRVEAAGSVLDVIGVVRWDDEARQRTLAYERPELVVPAAWLARQGDASPERIEVRVAPGTPLEPVVEEVRRALSLGDEGRARRYQIRTLAELLKETQEFGRMTLTVLLAVAAISLLVGGIGIANVMLTSVVERTREVGVRKALGATRGEIVLQFLVEAVVLTASGGALAVLSCWAGVELAPYLFEERYALALPVLPVLGALGLTILVGVVAGAYPASRAASLSAAEALRHE